MLSRKMHDRNVHLKRKVCSWHFYWKVYWKIYATKRKWGQMAEKKKKKKSKRKKGFPGGPVVKNHPADAGGTSSVPDLEKSHMLRSN